MNTQKVWCVFNPDGFAPKYTHHSEANAKLEAKRLARNNPEQRFYVMESVGCAIKNDVHFYVHSPENDYDELPF